MTDASGGGRLSVVIRDALTAFSLANLLFLSLWSLLLNGGNGYKLKSRLGDHLLALMLDVTLGAAFLWFAAYLVRRSGSSRTLYLGRAAFVLIVFSAFLRSEPVDSWLAGQTGKVAPALTLFVWCALAAVVATRPRVVRALRAFFLILFPFVPVTFGLGAWEMIKEQAAEPVRAEEMAPRLHVRPDVPRIVWIVYDELDYQLSFERRPPSVALPEIDRFRATALHATSAYPPSAQTALSIPALLDGRLVAHAEPRGASSLMITYHETTEPVRWGSQPNLFSRARAFGANSALVGWYHPYCRVFRTVLSQCSWWEGVVNPFAASKGSFLASMRLQGQEAARRLLPLPFNSSGYQGARAEAVRRRDVEDHEDILQHAQDMLRDAELGVVLIHIPTPHPPGIFDRREGAYRTDGELSYLDNMELADRDLGVLRRALEETGQWKSSVVIVSSDHGWRASFWRPLSWTDEDEQWSGQAGTRVPFLLKMPGQAKPIVYDRPFNTVLTSDLALAILQGKVSDAESAAAWIDRNRTVGLSPYMSNPW